MARPKKNVGKGFLLLDTKKKTYAEVPDRKTLIDRVTRILVGQSGPSEFAIVQDEKLAFDIEFNISFHDDEAKKAKPGRKPKKVRKVRKTRKVRKARKPRKAPKPVAAVPAKRGRKPKAKAAERPAQVPPAVEEKPAEKK